ncbi:MAG: hypothetical protein GY754_38485 [bacterium]|nr:hypothetical protein [bacterium]
MNVQTSESDYIMHLCQPDNTKSCVACCGLMNHSDLSRKNLTRFLNDGEFRTENSWRYQVEGCYPEQTTDCRDYSSHICPFHGFLPQGKPGCLIHPLHTGEEQRDMALYGAKTCEDFSCPAHKLFSDDIKKIIIENIEDWYLYTIAIIDPYSTMWILEQLSKAGPENKLSELLEIHGRTLEACKETVFCYSMEEYNLMRKDFSLTANNDRAEKGRQQILQFIEKNN